MNNDLPSGIAGARTKNLKAKYHAAVALNPADALFQLLRPIDPQTDPDGSKRADQLAKITALLVDMDPSYAGRNDNEIILDLMALAADKRTEPATDIAKKQLETEAEKVARKAMREIEDKKRIAALRLYRQLKRHELRQALEQRFPASAAMRAFAEAQHAAKALAKQEKHAARQAHFNNTPKARLMRRMNVRFVTHHRSRSF